MNNRSAIKDRSFVFLFIILAAGIVLYIFGSGSYYKREKILTEAPREKAPTETTVNTVSDEQLAADLKKTDEILAGLPEGLKNLDESLYDESLIK